MRTKKRREYDTLLIKKIKNEKNIKILLHVHIIKKNLSRYL